MFKKPVGKQYRVLAIVWTLAAAAMAVAVIRRLPEVAPMHLLLLVVSILIAAGSWRTWKNIEKNMKDQSLNQNSEDENNE